MRRAIAAFALVFLAAHLPFLPPTLEDVDSVNFALGVADFDVARHQPHPPGYPVFIALGKASTPLLRAAGVPAPGSRGLAVWSAIFGAALIALLFAFYRSLEPDERGPEGRGWTAPDARAFWAAAIATLSPLCWFTALRPLSDTTGFAAAVAAQALLVAVVTGRAGSRALTAGALVAGLAIGIRSQTSLLTLPLLALALVMPRSTLRVRDRLAAVAAGSIGVAAWGIPLIAASGGLSEYAAALGSQAGEDFTGVVMLWTSRTARVAAAALMNSFLWPWGGAAIGGTVVAVAAIGFVRAAWRRPRAPALLAVAFVPYAVFHLLFQETVTVRYALPLVAPVAYLVACALDFPSTGRWALPIGAAALAAASFALAVPAGVAYGREGSPTFRAFRAVESAPERVAGHFDAIGMHAVARRAADWEQERLSAGATRVLTAPHGREWFTLIQEWRSNPLSRVAFIADPKRTDLALFDPRSRRLSAAYRWPFVEPPFVGGARPGDADLYTMSPPGWMLDRGWAVTAEVAGITARDRLGPHRAPSVAWIRTRADDTLLLLGGRHLGSAGDPGVRVSLTLNGSPLDAFDASSGFFFRLVPLPAGALAAQAPYVRLDVQTRAADGRGREIPVGLEQFDLQSAGTPMVGAQEGWNEPEYNPLTARSWRWATERATLWVRPVGRDVTLTLAGESPMRYYDAPPVVTVTAAGRQIARFSPSSDFTQEIVLPADALASAEGRVVIESSKWFVPADRDGTADRRHLALRIYSYSVR